MRTAPFSAIVINYNISVNKSGDDIIASADLRLNL